MGRQIYVVNAMIVDANGAYHNLDGYPKVFDSKNYGGDIQKTYRRAQGDMYETWGAMCKRDDRLIQTVSLETINGQHLEFKTSGSFDDIEDEVVSE